MSKLSNILGVKEEQEFKIEGYGDQIFKISGNRRYVLDSFFQWVYMEDEVSLCDIISNPKKIKVDTSKICLTKEQIEAIKGRIAEGWLWLAKDGNNKTYTYTTKPVYDNVQKIFCTFSNFCDVSKANSNIFNFIKVGECRFLPGLIENDDNENS